MVALAVGLFLTVGLLAAQYVMSKSSARSGDIGQRDGEMRVAVDALVRDVSSAGFLIGGIDAMCYGILNYNVNAPGTGYFMSMPATSMAGGTGTVLPFVAAPSAITLNYPAANSTNRSDVLIVSGLRDTVQFATLQSPTVQADPSPTLNTLTTGVLPVHSFAQAQTTATLTAGDLGILRVVYGAAGSTASLCLRIPMTALSTVSGQPQVQSGGDQMPANFYTGFNGVMANFGLTGVALSNVTLQNAFLTDVNSAANNRLVTYAYYVDGTNFNNVPTLVRAEINALSDQVVAIQPIASGVVSMQVLFGVDTLNNGTVGAYQTGPAVIAAGNPPRVRTAKILLIQRALYADADTDTRTRFTNASSTVDVRTLYGENGYTNFTIANDFMRHRFSTQQIEVPLRNVLWPR